MGPWSIDGRNTSPTWSWLWRVGSWGSAVAQEACLWQRLFIPRQPAFVELIDHLSDECWRQRNLGGTWQAGIASNRPGRNMSGVYTIKNMGYLAHTTRLYSTQ